MIRIAIIPALNEAEQLSNLIERIRPQVDHIVVVDDASTDVTGSIARKFDCVVLRNPYSLGVGATTIRGLIQAKNIDASSTFICLDGDGQHDPTWIEEGICLAEIGKYDVVFGNRFATIDGISTTKIISNNFAWHCIKKLLGHTPICRDVCCGFRIYKNTTLNTLLNTSAIKTTGFAFIQASYIELHKHGLQLGVLSVPAIYNTKEDMGTPLQEAREFLNWLVQFPMFTVKAQRWLINLDKGDPLVVEFEDWDGSGIQRVAVGIIINNLIQFEFKC